MKTIDKDEKHMQWNLFCCGKNNKMQQYWNIDITVGLVGWKSCTVRIGHAKKCNGDVEWKSCK